MEKPPTPTPAEALLGGLWEAQEVPGGLSRLRSSLWREAAVGKRVGGGGRTGAVRPVVTVLQNRREAPGSLGPAGVCSRRGQGS